jgi:PAS domain S-box-containing protein
MKKNMFIIFIVLSVLIIASAFQFYKMRYHSYFLKQAENEISSIGSLKLEGIDDWRNERTRNLAVLQNPAFGLRVKNTIKFPDDAAVQKEMYDWLVKFNINYGYDRTCIHLIDGRSIIETSEEEVDMPHSFEDLRQRLFTNSEIIAEDFYYDKKADKVYFSVVAGMFDFSKGKEPLGVMIARIDPEDHLYPMLNNWPVPRRTAESFLVKKDGDKVILLSNCKSDKNSALKMIIPIEKYPEMPAVMAVKGKKGIVSGKNISGTEVIAYVDKIPHTDWFLISKMDYDEAMTPAQTAFKAIMLLSLLVILVMGLIFLYIVRFQRYSYYKEIAKKSAELAESEENLKITLRSIGDGVISTDTEGRITRMNKTAENLTGWNLSDAEGKEIASVFKIVNAYTRKEVLNPIELVMKDGKTVGLANHTVLIAKNGKEYQIADSAAPITDEKGEIHGMILVFSDVTEKYEAEQKRLSSERSFRKIVESAPVGIYIYELLESGSLIFTGYNSAADKIIGTDHNKFIGKTIEDAFPMLASTEIPEMYKKTASEGAIWIKDDFYYDYKGIKGSFNIVAFGIEKNRMAVMFSDISELKANHEEIKKLNETLEQKVKDRTRDLELSNKELESFSYSVSHDLRAPLRHIMAFADLMADGNGKHSESKEFLKKIKQSAADMGTLIDDLLEYSRTGRAEMRIAKININELVGHIQKRFAHENMDRKIDWQISRLPEVYCDESLIRTVWVNMIENAVKYTSKVEKAVIEIGCSEKPAEFEFFIRDNGAGFDMSYAHKLFGVFHRLHTKDDFEGTGIGLANVYRIISRHGGKVHAKGDTGQGAEFTFTIPKKKGTV